MNVNSKVKHFSDQLSQYPSRIESVFKATQFDRIVMKHCSDIDADRYQKEFSTEQWIKMLTMLQIKGYNAVSPFVEQLKQNNHWQYVCGLSGNVPVQSQFYRRIVDPKTHEILDRTFSTYQRLIPHKSARFNFTPNSWQLEILNQGFRPFKLDCTSIELSEKRYSYAKRGYVASKKEMLTSARLNTLLDGLYGVIANYQPAKGNQHESPLTDELFTEIKELDPWLNEFSSIKKLIPLFVFDRGYWKVKRFHWLDNNGYCWSIPWKKRMFRRKQFEILNFPNEKSQPLEILIHVENNKDPWRRIIGKLNTTDKKFWDVLTNNLTLKASTVLFLQKDRWEIEEVFSWLKKNTALKQPLGTSWESFITHCFIIVLLHLILVYFLLLLGFNNWRQILTELIRDLRHSDQYEWQYKYFIHICSYRKGGGY